VVKKENVCNHCGSIDLFTDSSQGQTTCNGCGSVLSQNNVVSMVEIENLKLVGGSIVYKQKRNLRISGGVVKSDLGYRDQCRLKAICLVRELANKFNIQQSLVLTIITGLDSFYNPDLHEDERNKKRFSTYGSGKIHRCIACAMFFCICREARNPEGRMNPITLRELAASADVPVYELAHHQRYVEDVCQHLRVKSKEAWTPQHYIDRIFSHLVHKKRPEIKFTKWHKQHYPWYFSREHPGSIIYSMLDCTKKNADCQWVKKLRQRTEALLTIAMFFDYSLGRAPLGVTVAAISISADTIGLLFKISELMKPFQLNPRAVKSKKKELLELVRALAGSLPFSQHELETDPYEAVAMILEHYPLFLRFYKHDKEKEILQAAAPVPLDPGNNVAQSASGPLDVPKFRESEKAKSDRILLIQGVLREIKKGGYDMKKVVWGDSAVKNQVENMMINHKRGRKRKRKSKEWGHAKKMIKRGFAISAMLDQCTKPLKLIESQYDTDKSYRDKFVSVEGVMQAAAKRRPSQRSVALDPDTYSELMVKEEPSLPIKEEEDSEGCELDDDLEFSDQEMTAIAPEKVTEVILPVVTPKVEPQKKQSVTRRIKRLYVKLDQVSPRFEICAIDTLRDRKSVNVRKPLGQNPIDFAIAVTDEDIDQYLCTPTEITIQEQFLKKLLEEE